jgi:hypothetical protein
MPMPVWFYYFLELLPALLVILVSVVWCLLCFRADTRSKRSLIELCELQLKELERNGIAIERITRAVQNHERS